MLVSSPGTVLSSVLATGHATLLSTLAGTFKEATISGSPTSLFSSGFIAATEDATLVLPSSATRLHTSSSRKY